MKISYIKIIIMVAILFDHFGCSPQKKSESNEDHGPGVSRKAVYAGQFYPGTKEALDQKMKSLFSGTTDEGISNVRAVISPHAGYVYSGSVAAQGFRQVDATRKYDHVFVIASSHRVSFDGASIYNIGNYETPTGEVKVDRQLAGELIKKYDVFTYRQDAHSQEHSLEVQLPFLQYILGEDFSIIPIVIGTRDANTTVDIAAALKPYFNENNLFIISSDFSHFPSYDDAKNVDEATARAIVSNNPDRLFEVIKENDNKNIGNLATSLCGWSSVATLLHITKEMPGINIIPIKYNNSGDAAIGDKDRVVGYYSIIVSREAPLKQADFVLGNKDKNDLLKIARQTINNYINNNTIPKLDPAEYSDNLHQHLGAFVTLNKEHKLRGCIGKFKPDIPLYEVVQKMAIAAATQDSRFDRVSPEEVPELEIEISVLTPLRKIESVDEIILGKHGIYIKKGWSSGTFLPQVATNTGWSLEEFLGHCSRDKAGLGWTGWKDAEIYIYEAIIIEE